MKIQLTLFIILLDCLVFAENQTNTNSLLRSSFEASVRMHSMAASQTNELAFQNLHQEFLGLDPTNVLKQCGSLTIRERSQPLESRIVCFATKGPEDVRGWIRVPDHSDPPIFGGFRSVPGKIYSEEEVAAGRLRNRLARQQVLDFLISHPDLKGEELWSEYWWVVWRLWLDDENFGHGPLCRAAEHRQEDGISKEGLILWFLGATNCCGEARKLAEYRARDLSLDPE